MLTALIIISVVTYSAIALETLIKINKSASALVGAGLLWTVYALSIGDPTKITAQLGVSIIATAQIVFFLMGAMAIVEVVDAHHGFEIITKHIRTSKLPTLLWFVGIVTFFLSATLDNLTTAVVMISVVRKLLARREDRLFFAGIIVIAANSGGAWSPIGDVTTTMLWTGGRITALAVIKGLFLPSAVSILVPLGLTTYHLRGRDLLTRAVADGDRFAGVSETERNLIFFLGLATLAAVPFFNAMTHLPPFLGVLFGLGVLWLAGDLMHRNKDQASRQQLTLTRALSRIDMSSLVFFTAILLAVATLEHAQILASLAEWLARVVGRVDVIVFIVGLVSSVVDNLPLVGASMGMYGLAQYPPDHFFWEFLAYCSGTGGSILVIGSAAGIAAMGLESVHFLWYLRKMSGLALVGYLAGAALYVVTTPLVK